MKKVLLFVSFFVLVISAVCMHSIAANSDVLVEAMTALDDYNCVWTYESGTAPVRVRSFAPDTVAPEAGSETPAAYDSRYNGFAFNTVNQGNTQGCWAISTINALTADCKAQGLYSQAVLSVSHLIWFGNNSFTTVTSDRTYGDGATYDKPFITGGYWFTPIFALARGCGAALESAFPFSLEGDATTTYTGMGNYPESDRYSCEVRLLEAEYLNRADTEKVKAEIIEHGAVKASYYSVSTYYNRGADGYCYCQKTRTNTNHAITVVGWDDSFKYTNFKSSARPTSNGAWLCRNSWGDDWGDDGYFWISYEDTSFSLVSAFTADSERYDSIYQYDGCGFSKRISSSGLTSVKQSNVFTADSTEYLCAVGFYTMQDNTDCTAEVYTGVADTPTDGALVASAVSHEEYTGYHTIKLDENVMLTKGDNFSVVITIKSTDGVTSAYIPVEGKESSFSEYDSEPGQSWVYFSDWVDASADYNNVCVKALTNDNCTHSYIAESFAPTCTAQGYTKYTCEICSDSYDGDFIDMKEHSYITEIIEPTCTAQGYTKYTCEICSHNYDGDFVGMTEHSYKTEIIEPTCTAQGYTTYTCEVCSHSYDGDFLPATGHEYIDRVVLPDCENEGYTKHICKSCRDTYTDSVKAALGHIDADLDGKCDRCETTTIDTAGCVCICHNENAVYKILYKILRIIYSLFGIRQYCDCGIRHY